MTYLAGLSFPGQYREPAIHCDGPGCGATIVVRPPPPAWFLDGKAKRGWRLYRVDGRRHDYCPACKEKLRG